MDQYTTATGSKFFKVRTEPTGESFLVLGANAVDASQKVPGLMSLYKIPFNGSFDVNPATDEEIEAALRDSGEEE